MKVLAILLLLSNVALADEAFLGYGVGVFHDADDFLGQNKYLGLGLRSFLWEGLYWQNKVLAWGEGSSDPTRKGGAMFASGIGQEVSIPPVEIRGGGSLAIISNPDSQLGAMFPQFHEEISLGLRDSKGDGIALQYGHISCASFCTPNQGKDFVIFELSQKW